MVTAAAELGEGDYRVFATDRGGITRLGEVTHITSLQFDRRRDDTSACRVVVHAPDGLCCDMLGSLRTIRNELVVYRNGKRVWEGPITLLHYSTEGVEIDCRDITFYLSRRAFESDFDYTGISFPVLKAMRDMLHFHYPVENDPYNIGQYVTIIESDDDPNTAAVFKKFSRTVGNVLDQYAARGGIDYTVSGRRLIIMDAHVRAHVLPKMTDEHLNGSIHLTEYGMELKTRTFLTNSEGKVAPSVAPDEWLNYYGPVDFVDNNTDEGDGDPDEEDLLAMQELAERILLTGYPTPVRLWIPDDSRLDPCYPADFDAIQASAWVPIQSKDTCRQFAQWQKLQRMDVTWTPGSESINVTLTKAPDEFVEPRPGGVPPP